VKRTLLVLASAFLIGADAPPPAPAPYLTVAPALSRSALTSVEKLGYELYLRDIVASRATDAALATQDFSALGVRGWIVVPRGEEYLARFLTQSGDSAVDVLVDPFSASPPKSVVANSPPKSLDERESGMWRARELATQQAFSSCSDRYNSVVLPVSDSPSSDWYVYLLAATVDPTKIMLGGHHRYRIDRTGSTVLEHLAMSKSCISTVYDSSMVMISVSHIVTNEPLETHVYLNLLHGLSVGVVIIETQELFAIDNGHIRRVPNQ